MSTRGSKSETMPGELVGILDAAIESAIAKRPPPKTLGKLFEWIFWNGGGTEFELPYFNLPSLNLSDADLHAELELSDRQTITDELRLDYARGLVDRIWQDGERLTFAHAFRIERDDGGAAYLCGMSWMAGQGGHQTNCDGLFESPEDYLQSLERADLSSECSSSLPLVKFLEYWGR